jgi:hypothetical protein
MILLQRKHHFYAGRVSVSIAGFGPYHQGIGRRQASSLWRSAGLAFDQSSALRGRFPAHEIVGCPIFCRKKIFERQQNYACTLTATTWLRCGLDPPATFVGSVFRNIGARAFLQQERRYSGGVETSACRRIRDVNCPQDPAPGRQQYGRSRRCP